jgi:hypothetical protein
MSDSIISKFEQKISENKESYEEKKHHEMVSKVNEVLILFKGKPLKDIRKILRLAIQFAEQESVFS